MRMTVDALTRIWKSAERSRAVLPVLAGICLCCSGSSMLMTAVSLRLGQPGIDPHTVQIVLTAYPAGFLIGCLAAKAVVVRIGHENAFTLVLLMAFAAGVGFIATDYVPAWFGLRLFGGLAMASMFVICESWINLYATHRDRGAMFALYMLSTSLAVLLGQLTIGLIGPGSPYVFEVALAFVAISFLPRLTGWRWPAIAVAEADSGQPVAGRLSLGQLFRIAPVTLVSVFQSGVTNMNIFVLTPIYATHIGLSPATTVALVTTVSIAGMLAQTPAGWLSDRFDRRALLLARSILSLGMCGAIAALGGADPALLFVLFFIYGATTLTIYPVAIAYANSRLPSRHMVAASGTFLLVYSVGNVGTPGLAAGLMTRMGPQAMFFLLGSGALIVATTACYNLLRKEPALNAV